MSTLKTDPVEVSSRARGECHAGDAAGGAPIETASQRDDPNVVARVNRIAPGLFDVSETMLWSLHNRASETRRRDGVLVDPESLRIHEAIDYDFARRFGDPHGSLAARSAEIDRAIRAWLERNPDGCVVSLGEGLETQRKRVDNGRMRWLSVDLPDAMRLRERFLPPTDRFRHVAASALDPAWMDAIDPSRGVFMVLQGLLMYLEPASVRQLFTGVADRFPAAEIVFDTVPRWFSQLTLAGLHQTADYRLPSMPWGIDRDEVEPTLRRWHPRVGDVAFLAYRVPRGLPRLLADAAARIPFVRQGIPSLVHVAMATPLGRSATHPAIDAEETPWEFAIAARRPRESELTAAMTTDMNANCNDSPSADTIEGVLNAAAQNAKGGGDIARATRKVVARRMALGMAAAIDPLRADHAEFARMVPEKVEAFSSAGMAMLRQSDRAGRHMMRYASDEVMTSARATIEMIGCSGPAALAESQGRFARAWVDRATSGFIALGMLAVTAQAAAMTQIRKTVVANAERLG
jgi:O-methyltransferase involved in polyketide biosynthesis